VWPEADITQIEEKLYHNDVITQLVLKRKRKSCKQWKPLPLSDIQLILSLAQYLKHPLRNHPG